MANLKNLQPKDKYVAAAKAKAKKEQLKKDYQVNSRLDSGSTIETVVPLNVRPGLISLELPVKGLSKEEFVLDYTLVITGKNKKVKKVLYGKRKLNMDTKYQNFSIQLSTVTALIGGVNISGEDTISFRINNGESLRFKQPKFYMDKRLYL